LLYLTPKSITWALNISFKICIVLSNYSLVWGWKAELNWTLFPKASENFNQNWEVNHWPLSGTIELGTPCNVMISLTKIFASFCKPIYHHYWQDMSWIGQMVNYYPNQIITLMTLRQTRHKIHSYPFSFLFRNQ